jgi:hypothetical protein
MLGFLLNLPRANAGILEAIVPQQESFILRSSKPGYQQGMSPLGDDT